MLKEMEKAIKELSETSKYVPEGTLITLRKLTYTLKEGQLPLTDETKEKIKKVVRLLLKLQRKKNKMIKHDGYWQVCMFDGGIDPFYGIVREPTADIISFLTTVHFKITELKRSSRLKKAINKALFFEGVAYIGIRGDIFAYFGNTPENFRYMLRRLLTGLTPRYAATYYKKHRELLPILSAFVKLYKKLGEAYSICYFLENADLPPHLSYLRADKELVEFLKAIKKFIDSQNQTIKDLQEDCVPESFINSYGCNIHPFNVKEDYEELYKQFKEANFYPHFLKNQTFGRRRKDGYRNEVFRHFITMEQRN